MKVKVQLKKLQRLIGYRFRNEGLLLQALTHRSYRFEIGEGEDNERLEFLGDSALELAITHLLFTHFPQLDEGGLSKVRASLVKEGTIASIARCISLGDLLLLGRGEEATGGRGKDSLLAAGLEALVAAIYLDGGYPAVLKVVETLYAPILQEMRGGIQQQDFKTSLQEFTQMHLRTTPRYQLVAQHGPPHARAFEVIVTIGGKDYGRGKGRSKKEAEQQAAAQALSTLKGREHG